MSGDHEVGNVMIDIETLGKRPGCIILSIAAVPFYGVGRIATPRQWIISRTSCINAGVDQEDLATLRWWQEQPETARTLLERVDSSDAFELPIALGHLANVCRGRRLWCKGVGFDFPILEEAYRRCGFREPPWHYRDLLDYRTLAAIRPDIAPEKQINAHDAASDAMHQAKHAALILEWLRAPEKPEADA